MAVTILILSISARNILIQSAKWNHYFTISSNTHLYKDGEKNEETTNFIDDYVNFGQLFAKILEASNQNKTQEI